MNHNKSTADMRGDELVAKWPNYSQMIHDTIMDAPDRFYFIMDVQAHIKIVKYICDHYFYSFSREVEKKVSRALPEHMQDPNEPYHGPGCEDCGGLEITVERISIRKDVNKHATVTPMKFNITNPTNSLQRPTVYTK